MDDLLADFVAETREMIEALESEVIAWESNPSDRARLDSIFRFVHTVKGNCGFFDFPRLEKLSHAAEGALAEVRAGRRQPDSRFVSAVLAIIDRISHMTGAIEAGEPMPKQGDEFLIAALEPDADDPNVGVAAQTSADRSKHSEASSAALRSIRLPVELLDRVMSGVSDMVLARNDLARRLRAAGNEPTLDGPFERLSGILTDVRDAVTRMRMQRIEHIYNALPRLVRDLSAELGKQVMVDFDGGDVELDREMIEMIRDPVTHLVRNAIDHGIEKPADRIAAGKREIGMLAIAARQSGNRITIAISDDGAGLNVDKIGEKAVTAGIVTQADLDGMTREAIANLIFEAGLSTAEQVSSISGRGVGMDVVRANLEKIGGSISVAMHPGEGTIFNLQIPLTLSIISALTVSIGTQRFAIPQSYVEEIAHGASSAIQFSRVGGADLVTFRERRIPCLTLNNILGVNPRPAGPDQRVVLLRLGNGSLFALTVDRILDQEDLVIKPLAPIVMQAGIYAGTTLLDDGSPVLMLDIPNIAARHGLVTDIRARPSQAAPQTQLVATAKGRTLMSFTGFDGRIRAIGMELIDRIDEAASDAFDFDGERSQVVIDGQIRTVVGADANDVQTGKIKLLRLSDSRSEIAYAVAELGETFVITSSLTAYENDPSIEGIALLGDKPVPVVDAYRLFALFGGSATSQEQLICRLPEGNEWAQRMLAPLIASAGYRISGPDDLQVDVAISFDGEEHIPDTLNAAQLVTLHDDPDNGAATAGTIYRYDWLALLEALKQARSAIERKRA
ncbi:MAG: chemotaxis protein CheA [Pontixanthobacter sp.]